MDSLFSLIILNLSYHKIAPKCIQGNGKEQRFMQPLTKTIQTTGLEDKNILSKIQKFFVVYQTLSHLTTKLSC